MAGGCAQRHPVASTSVRNAASDADAASIFSMPASLKSRDPERHCTCGVCRQATRSAKRPHRRITVCRERAALARSASRKTCHVANRTHTIVVAGSWGSADLHGGARAKDWVPQNALQIVAAATPRAASNSSLADTCMQRRLIPRVSHGSWLFAAAEQDFLRLLLPPVLRHTFGGFATPRYQMEPQAQQVEDFAGALRRPNEQAHHSCCHVQ